MSNTAALDKAIRAKLKGHFDAALMNNWTDYLDAIEAVLDLHQPFEDGVCSCLPDSDDTHVAHCYPCPTVRTVAEKLGIALPAAT